MDQKLKEFFEKNEAIENEAILNERKSVLLDCGLYSIEKQYSEKSAWGYKYDQETKKYCKEVKVPLEVTDDEYGRILEIYRKKKAADAEEENELKAGKIHLESVNPRAERILNFIITFKLVLTIIYSAMFLVTGIILNSTLDVDKPLPLVIGITLAVIILAYGLVAWALQKVVINISNNLHNISTKTPLTGK